MELTQEDINELLVLLKVANFDARVLQGQSHDVEEIEAIDEHRASIRKWITRLSKQIKEEPGTNE